MPDADDLTDKQRQIRERRLANLIPFQPGKSGNPAGRPKKKTISEAYAELLQHEDSDGVDMATAIAKQVLGGALNGDLDAIKEVTDRVEGKPKQRTELSGTLGIEEMTREQRRARIAELAGRLDRSGGDGTPDADGDGESG